MIKLRQLILFTVISFGFAQEKFTVTGTVQSKDGDGVKKVKLVIQTLDGEEVADGKSKGGGEFKFKKVPVGEYKLFGTHKKLGSGETTFSVLDQDVEVSFTIGLNVESEKETSETLTEETETELVPKPKPKKLPTQQQGQPKETLEFGDHFFEYETNLKALQTQIDSLKSIVKGYEKRQNMPDLDRSLLDLIHVPDFVHRIELKNGTVVLGDLLEESDSTLTLQTQIGRLVLKKEMVVRMEEFDKPGPKVIFVGEPFIDMYPDRHIFTGKVKNVGEKRADFVRVLSNLFDQTTTQVGQDSIFVKGSKMAYQSNVVADTALEPGQTVQYQLSVPIHKGKKVQYHTMDIHWEETE